MLTVTPAIDLRKGKVIRLYRGVYNKETIYSEDPLSIAMQWKDAGAQILHIIDLDGAFSGKQRNLDIIKTIINETGLKIHLGGGIRSEENIEDAIKAGVHKVIMSTKIFQDKDFIRALTQKLRDRIIASIDSKSGIVVEKAGQCQQL